MTSKRDEKTIQVSYDTWKRLTQMKLDMGYDSLDRTIEVLLNGSD